MTTIEPCSDIQHREEQQHEETRLFYQGLIMRRAHGHGARKVYVGDVVAISCPSSFSPPYPPPGGKQGKDPKYPLDTHWKVGLVLALYADVAAEDDIDDTYSMTVLWLHRYVHLPKTPLFKEVHDKIKTLIKPLVRNSLLIESSDIETDIPFYRVLLQPRIALGEKQENIWGNQDQGEDFPMLLNLSCQYRFCGPEKNIIERTKGWELFNSTEQGTKAPDFLVKAWDNPNFPWHKDSSFKEKQMTFYEREVEEKMKDRIEIQKRLQEEADEDDGEPQQGNTENKPKAKKPTKPILKSSKSSKSNINKENNRSLSTKKQPPIKKKKEILSKNNKAKSTSVTKSTASKTKAKVSLKESKSSKPSAKNKKPAPKSSKGKKRAHSKSETTAANILSKKRRISSAEETDDSSTVMSEEDRLVPIPPSRRIKGKNITFFDGVELPWDTLRWDASLRKNHDNGSWKFHVGDIVAVACQESRHPPHLAQSKKPWFPYKVAWSAAQVLSIFENPNLKRTKGDKNDFSKFQMKVRFFFRWNELEDVAREHVKKAHPKAAAHLQKDIHAILESYAKGDTYNWPVTAAIGNLSFMGDNSGALSPQASAASLPPTVAVQCHYKLAEGEEEDENGETENHDIAPASNWVHYYTSDKRGLEPFLRSQLKFEGISTNFYTNSIKNRWGIKDTKRKAKCMTSPLVSAQSKQNNPIRWVPATWKMPHIDDDGTWLENVEKSSDLALFHPLRNSKRIHRASSVDPMNNRAPGAERALDFYDSLEIPLLASRFDPKFASLVPKILDGRAMSSFTVKVGDVVCFATANTVATSPRESCEMKSVYYPYKGSWKVGQVLAIHSRNVKSHRTRHSKDVCAEEASLEVRWLPRVLELPLEWQRHLSLGHLAGSNLSNSTSSTWGPPMANFDVIESDKVETIPATYVLGPTELLHGIYGRELVGTKTTTVATGRRRSNKLATPIIRCNLHNLFYWKQHNSVETIYIPVDNNLAADKCVEVARRTFFERGKSFSTTLKENTTLLETPSYKGLNPTQILSASQQVAWKFPPVVPLWSEPCNQNGFISDREYYGVVNITPPWESYLNPLCDVRDRSNLCWSVGVGDLVAVRAAVLGDTANNFGKQGSLFPFKERWAAAQVLAIYKDRSNSSVDEENGVPNTYLLQLRAFHCESDTSANAVEMVWETRKVVPADERCHASPPTTTDLIGPIILYPAHGRDKHHSVVVNPHSFLPEAPLIYGGEANGRNYSEKIARPLDILDTAKRGVYLSSHYKSDEQRGRLVSLVTETYQEHFRNQRRAITSLFQQFIGEVATKSAISDNSTGENSREECDALYDDSTYSSRQRVLVPNVPIHFDKSSKRSYFDRILVNPALNNMAIRKAIESRNDPWEVKLGDIVAVHYTDNYRSSGPAYFEPCAADYPHVKREETPNFPFAARTPWGIAEVVCIWALQEDEPKPSANHFVFNSDVEVEVRWFYRKKEVPGFLDDNIESLAGSADILEEILETDHIEDVPALSLLAPVSVHSYSTRSSPNQFKMGMPVLDFFCRRFFSIIRRSLLPCGGLEGRATRGKFHSRYIRADGVLRELLVGSDQRSKKPTHLLARSGEQEWREAFMSVIQKLSLTDASKESSESVMIGREKEQNNILSFLKSAICGGSEETGSSMFVAGPPGTGKSGSVRAAIAKLQREQASGLIPPFRFVSLNGMEMRHPFEAYIRLLEALKGGTKIRKSEEEATAWLEKYFTTTAHLTEEEEELVTVVLLDEIDYLVTQKQTVMYNFFDWPRRSASLFAAEGRGRRLVVIGVSNTLNLPERLQPRVQSRIGNRRCYFKSYNVKEIQSILQAKINQASPDCAVFDEEAILFAARKTAAVSGDVRKAFHICRSAAEMVLNNHLQSMAITSLPRQSEVGHPVVKIPDVQRVSKQASDSCLSKAVAQATPFEALLLISLSSLSRSTGRERNGFDIEEVMTKMESVAGSFGDEQYTPPPRFEETLFMLNRLADAQIINLRTPTNASMSFRSSLTGMGGAWPIASLLMDGTNILLALRGTKHNALAQKYLAKSAF